ncbi:MAG: lytic transglycosylase domain-containing protein [Rhodocyclaceae bacterium]
MPFFLRTRRVLATLLLAGTPVLHAGECGASPLPSPYRHEIDTDRALRLNGAAAPYRFDQRYRLEPIVSAELSGKPYFREIDAAARDSGLDPALVHAVVAVESAYRPSAVSPKGAVGLMQVLPATALSYGVTDPEKVGDNLRVGTRHLRGLMERFDNRLDLVLAAYNAGEGAVKRYNNTVPPYAETRRYVPAVLGRYQASSRPLAVKAPAGEYLPGTRLDSTICAGALH